jgi:hypothetical protein
LVINGVTSSNLFDVKELIIHFYSQLYPESEHWCPDVDGLPLHSIGEKEVIWLERAFEVREVFELVKDMNGDKALGPDSFPMAFF